MTTTLVHTAGQTVAVHGSEVVVRSLVEASGGPDRVGGTIGEQPDVVLEVEAVRRPFTVHGFEVVTRGVWTNGSGEVVLADVGGSGFDQRWTIDVDGLHVASRWRPSHQALAAARLLPARHRALSSQVLLHYPALWFAMQRGGVPLHVSMVEVGGVAVLLAGPGGVGKSTLVARAMADGARASCDNVAVYDGVSAYGLAEPLRLLSGSGRRAFHGRREQPWAHRVRSLPPELVVVLRRGAQSDPCVRQLEAGEAARRMVAGTYSAGELRRFWPLAAVLASATGCGPVHPPIEQMAAGLADRLPCVELLLGHETGAGLTELLGQQLTAVRVGRAG
jgi:hypothetical protein